MHKGDCLLAGRDGKTILGEHTMWTTTRDLRAGIDLLPLEPPKLNVMSEMQIHRLNVNDIRIEHSRRIELVLTLQISNNSSKQ